MDEAFIHENALKWLCTNDNGMPIYETEVVIIGKCLRLSVKTFFLWICCN